MTTNASPFLPGHPRHGGTLVCCGCGDVLTGATNLDTAIAGGSVRSGRMAGAVFHKACRYDGDNHKARRAHNAAMLDAWKAGAPAKSGKPTRKGKATPQSTPTAEPMPNGRGFMQWAAEWRKWSGKDAKAAGARWKEIKDESKVDVPMAAEPEAPAPAPKSENAAAGPAPLIYVSQEQLDALAKVPGATVRRRIVAVNVNGQGFVLD